MKARETVIAVMSAILLTLPVMPGTAQPASGKSDDFHGHWFIQVQGGIGHTIGEASFGNLISPAAAFNFGYRFTPVWSLRAGLDGWQGKGGLPAIDRTYSYSYLQGNVDVMVDICSIFSGYRMSRAVSPYLFAGVGLNGGLCNSEAQGLASSFPADNLLWDKGMLSPAGRFGVGTGIRITDAVQFNLEVNANVLNDKFNSKRGSAADWQLGALAGFTFNIGLKKGRKAEPAPVPVAAPVETPAPAPAPESEPKPEPKPEPAPVVKEEVKAFDAVERYVYFTIGKTVIRDSEKVKIEELAELLKSHPETMVTVTGHADKATGSAGRNMELSKERARNVAAALMDAGIPAERITILYKGDTANPFSSPEKNRVAICVVDDGE